MLGLWVLLVGAADTAGVRMVSMQGSVSRFTEGVTQAVAVEGPGIIHVGDRVTLVDDAVLRLDGPGRIDLTGAGEIALVKPGRYRWEGRAAYVEAAEDTLFFDVGRSSVHVRDSRVRMRRVDDGLFVEVLGGKRTAVFTPGKLVTVEAGYGVYVDLQGRARKPVALHPGPTAIAPAPDGPLQTFRFAWRPVGGARTYRLELARDESFREILYAGQISGTTVRDGNRTLPVGTLYWRVTAVGEDGFMGLPSPARAVRILR